jgi:hypothetical protein
VCAVHTSERVLHEQPSPRPGLRKIHQPRHGCEREALGGAGAPRTSEDTPARCSRAGAPGPPVGRPRQRPQLGVPPLVAPPEAALCVLCWPGAAAGGERGGRDDRRAAAAVPEHAQAGLRREGAAPARDAGKEGGRCPPPRLARPALSALAATSNGPLTPLLRSVFARRPESPLCRGLHVHDPRDRPT